MGTVAKISSSEIESKFIREFEKRLGSLIQDSHLSLVLQRVATYPHVQVYIRRRVDDKLTQPIAVFQLTSMPGCCGVVVSHNTEVVETYQGKGLGNLMQDMKIWLGTQLKFGKMVATTIETNTQEIHLLQKYGWKKSESFANPRTGNRIVAWERSLV